MTTPEAIAAFRARINPNIVARLDAAPAEPIITRSFVCPPLGDQPPTRPSEAQWNAFATAYADDPLCAGMPQGMTVVRDPTVGTTISYFWSPR